MLVIGSICVATEKTSTDLYLYPMCGEDMRMMTRKRWFGG